MKNMFVCPSYDDFPDIYLYMDQAISVLEKYLCPFYGEKPITSTMINNYVKQKIISAPENKKYSRKVISHIFMVCILKSFMQLSDIHILIEKLSDGKSPEEAFGIFKREFDGAISAVFEDKKALSFSDDTGEVISLRAALTAYGAILKAKEIFAAEKENWHEEKEPAKK